jgi:hypothetical protein
VKSNGHPALCNCGDAMCWEPIPKPGQSVDDACREEMIKELALMPDEHLGFMLEAVSAEQQRRHPVNFDVGAHKGWNQLKANTTIVKEIIDVLIEALEKRINDESKETVGLLDVFMACCNFWRLVIESHERIMNLDDIEEKRAYRYMAIATFQKTLVDRLKRLMS